MRAMYFDLIGIRFTCTQPINDKFSIDSKFARVCVIQVVDEPYLRFRWNEERSN